jgi:hypothetical protein
MNALSVRQPWAWAIVAGRKPIENRTWQTDYRGPLLIHAGLRGDPDGFEFLESHGVHIPEDLPRGGIIGQVELIDITTDHPSMWAQSGCFNWVLADPIQTPFRFLRGRLGLFEA